MFAQCLNHLICGLFSYYWSFVSVTLPLQQIPKPLHPHSYPTWYWSLAISVFEIFLNELNCMDKGQWHQLMRRTSTSVISTVSSLQHIKWNLKRWLQWLPSFLPCVLRVTSWEVTVLLQKFDQWDHTRITFGLIFQATFKTKCELPNQNHIRALNQNSALWLIRRWQLKNISVLELFWGLWKSLRHCV